MRNTTTLQRRLRFGIVTLSGLLTVLLLTSCGPDPQQQKAKQDADSAALKRAAEQKLFADPVKGVAELKRRLRAHVRVEDDLLVVRGDFFDEISVMPTSAPWSLNCGLFGMQITFGLPPKGGQDNISEPATVHLSGVKCQTAAIPVAQEVRAILDGK